MNYFMRKIDGELSAEEGSPHFFRNDFEYHHRRLLSAQTRSYKVKNISSPREVVDQLRVALQGIHAADGRANTLKRWSERESSESGYFEFEMEALHMAAKATDHIKNCGKAPACWKNQSNLQKTDYRLSLERRKYLRDMYGFDDLEPDDSDEDKDNETGQKRYDPFDPDWSKKTMT